jgi:hypothetical protein
MMKYMLHTLNEQIGWVLRSYLKAPLIRVTNDDEVSREHTSYDLVGVKLYG